MKLFSPVKIGQLELKNRISMPAMHHNYTPDGYINDRLIAYYKRRACGGAGLITVGGCSIDLLGAGRQMIGARDDSFIPGLSELAEAIKGSGAAAAAQLYHAGRYSFSFMIDGKQAIAPSAVPSRLTRETPREMAPSDIEKVIEDFGAAAERIKKAGFDAVEIIASAGYLISQFLSPLTNHRTDQYGGSPENRVRFGIEVLERVRKGVGGGFPVIFRISGHDFIPGGNGVEEAAYFAAALDRAGVDAVNVTGGWHESRVPQITGDLPRGGFAWLAGAVKAAVTVPVMASNRINDPLTAEEILLNNQADLINMGRPLLADPDLPVKAQSGRFSSIRRCIACNQGCLDMVFSLADVHCAVNPAAGREYCLKSGAAGAVKKVLVVGGGPAGMEAARTAAARGHRVSIYEREMRLGGKVSLAAKAPGKGEFINLISFYEDHLPRLGVEIHLNHCISAGEIVDLAPDFVIVATGSMPAVPTFPVKAPELIASAEDVLRGTYVPGEKTVVVGGGSVGCETALYIARKGRPQPETVDFLLDFDAEEPEKVRKLQQGEAGRVALVELQKDLARDMGVTTRWIVLGNLRRANIKIFSPYRVMEVNGEGLIIENSSGPVQVPAESVIFALGGVKNDSLAAALEGRVCGLAVIGDARSPGKIDDAVREGFDVAMGI